MEHFLGDAKRLVHRLHSHDNAVDILIGEATNLQNKLIAMRQYHEEVNKMNENANHRPRSTLILGSQLENQRIQNLEQENRELSLSLAEHQSALELIMNKYREQVLIMMKANGTQMSIYPSTEMSTSEVAMKEKIAEMANVMRQSALIDESVATKEIEILRSLQVENDNLRELLEISGKKVPGQRYDFEQMYNSLSSDFPSFINSPGVGQKDSGIYENVTFSNLKTVDAKKKSRLPVYYDSVENLYTVSNEEEDLHGNDYVSTETGFERTEEHLDHLVDTNNSVENCFRAIITDIKPLDADFDLNEEVVGSKNIYFGNDNDMQDPDLEVVQEKVVVKIDTEAPDDSSFVSKEHMSETNKRILNQMEHLSQNTLNYSDLRPMHNEGVDEDEPIDEMEKEMMKNFVAMESLDLAATTGMDKEVDESHTEDSVLELLDNALDLDEDDHDDDNSDEEYVDEVHTNVSSDEEEDAFHEFSFHKNINKSHGKNQKVEVNNINSEEYRTLADEDKPSLNKAGLSLSNGDISDTDSEVTITEDDLHEALSGFDSIVNDIDNDDQLH